MTIQITEMIIAIVLLHSTDSDEQEKYVDC